MNAKELYARLLRIDESVQVEVKKEVVYLQYKN